MKKLKSKSKIKQVGTPPLAFKSAEAALHSITMVASAVIQRALTEIQGGKYGAPTMDDLDRCGTLHSILEQLSEHRAEDQDRRDAAQQYEGTDQL